MHEVKKTTVTYYFGVLHHLMLVPSITMTLRYIGMGVGNNFPPSPRRLFSFEPLIDTVFTKNPSSSYKSPLTLTWVGPLPQHLYLRAFHTFLLHLLFHCLLCTISYVACVAGPILLVLGSF
jgi:hypothetical protein